MARTTSMQKRWASEPVQIETPPDVRLLAGWIGGAQGALPEAKWENWWHNRVDEALHEIESTGAPQWFDDVPYQPLALARRGGKNWICRIANTGIAPDSVSNTGQWAEEVDASSLLPKRSFSEIDYIRIPDAPGGLIIQFGGVTLSSGASGNFALPIAFPNAALRAVACFGSQLAGGQYACGASLISKTHIRITNGGDAAGGAVEQGISYIAIGY